MSEHPLFWYVHARLDNGHRDELVSLAVAAFTERSARMQARKRLGPNYIIDQVSAVKFAHAWVINHAWVAQRVESAMSDPRE